MKALGEVGDWAVEREGALVNRLRGAGHVLRGSRCRERREEGRGEENGEV